MRTRKSKILDLYVSCPEVFKDSRGLFVEYFNHEAFKKIKIPGEFVRDCISVSVKNVLRGIHYDDVTWKLIQCMMGKIYFVVVDMRPDSDTYLKWESFILSEDNRLQVLVPPMYGNGHLVLSDRCIFHYKMTEYYHPENERVLKWDDSRVNIPWPNRNPILSEKDSQGFNPIYKGKK